MITTSDETWATTTLRDAQEPSDGQWLPLTKITLERHNLQFTQQHSRSYSSTAQPEHDCGTVLEDSLATLFKVALVSGNLTLTKWSVAAGLQYDDVTIAANANISDTAAPSMELTAGWRATVRVFYVDENDDEICYIESTNGAASFGAEVSVDTLSDLKAIASTSTTKLHAVTYASGNSRFHYYEYSGGAWNQTDSLLYWPHEIDYIDAITIGDCDLIVFYSEGPIRDDYQEGGVYGVWYDHGRWSDLFKIDVLDEESSYAYRQYPMLSTANGYYFLTLYVSEGDADYNTALRAVKISRDGDNWSQYMPLISSAEGGPAKLLVVNAASGQSWPWSTGQQVYVTGYDKIYESDATRLVGEENSALQTDVTSRTVGWDLTKGVIAQGNTLLSNHDGGLDDHSIINGDNTLLLKREAGYRTSAGNEYAQIALELMDYLNETDRLPQRHKQVASRDYMAWMRDKMADHYEEWVSQLVGYDNFDDDTETGSGGMMHVSTQKGWWDTENNVLWLKSDNEMGLCFMTWSGEIMNGQVKSGIRIETAGNDEYAGVVFRGRDEGNFWACYYDETTDKILLRQRAGGGWLAVAAQSPAILGWSIDTWYALLVDFRYSYIRVFYSTDGLTWTQDFTHTIEPNALNTAPEYGYVGLVGYGYSSEDGDEDWGYEPPTPPTTPLPTGSGELVYMVCEVTGRIFRTRNARNGDATAVTYEDLGVVDAGGLTYIALDSWDPQNKAMVIGPNGVWRTTNLNDTTPSWTCVLDLSVTPDGYQGKMVASSICQQGLWMVTSQTAAEAIRVYWTTDDGTNWSFTGWSGVAANNDFAKVECSAHDANIAWVTWMGGAGGPVVTKTDDQWASSTQNALGTGTWDWPANPHHRYLDNADDNVGFYAGGNTTRYCSADYGTCTDGTLDGGGRQNDRVVHWIGSYTWGTTKYWALTCGLDPGVVWRFHISDDAVNWTLQHEFTGVTHFISGWPYDGEYFYAGQDGTTAPLLVSEDRGENWQEQTGNWATLCTAGGYDPDILCVVPVWTA